MKRLAAFALVAGSLLPACGIGLHSNSTVSRTLPYHAPLSELLDYPQIADVPVAALPSPFATTVTVMRFGAYYPKPAALLVKVSGTAQWGVLENSFVPEKELTTLFEGALERKSDPPGNWRNVQGVITGFEWYALVDGNGAVARSAGRVSSLLTVSDGSGKVLFEAERTTTGTAPAPDALYRAHARAWLSDAGFLKAVTQAGGGS